MAKALTGWFGPREAAAEPARVTLHLSGPRLARSLAKLVSGCEASGGIERYVEALKLKSAHFRDTLGDAGERAAALEPTAFKALCPFMATVRRRIAPWLERPAFDPLPAALAGLVRAFGDGTATDACLAEFGASFADRERERWIRDLAAEVLHNVAPERFPLMTRWVWDAAANTGVIRELWFADDVDHVRIGVPDRYATFLALREELSQYLSQNGFFRDILQYVDLLSAQVYADYICEQGGSYLRTDFAAEEDSLQYTRRLLGLDGVKAGSGRTRLKTIDGEAHVLDEHPDVRLLD